MVMMTAKRPGGLTRRGLHPSRSPFNMTPDERERRHLALFLQIAEEADPETRARRATEELLRLQTEALNFTYLRDVAVYRLAADGHSYSNVGAVVGLTKDRAAQLVRRAKEVNTVAVQHVSKIKRRARAINSSPN